MQNSPLLLLLLIAAGLYLAWLWWQDLQAARAGQPSASPLPGATPTSPRAVVLAVLGAVALLAVETGGERALGFSDQQSQMTVLFGLYTLVAAVLEEIIFRGYLVIEKRGRAVLWAGIVAASLLFALLHPFLWKWEDAGFEWTITRKEIFSTAIVFAFSLWLYAARFASWNPTRSLLPCFAAHLAKNVGVFGIKAADGFLSGWW